MRVFSAAEIDAALSFPALIEALRRAFAAKLIAPERHHHSIAQGADWWPGQRPCDVYRMVNGSLERVRWVPQTEEWTADTTRRFAMRRDCARPATARLR